jgi:hypothetical protein
MQPWIEMKLPPEPFRVSLDARYNDGRAQIASLAGDVGRHRLNAVGELSGGAGPTVVAGEVRLSGDSLPELLSWTGVEANLREEPYLASAEIVATTNRIEVAEIEISSARSDLSGVITVTATEPMLLDVNLHSDQVYLPTLLPDPLEETQESGQGATSEAPGNSLTVAPTSEQMKERLIPDLPLPTDWIGELEGRWRYTVDQFSVREDVSADVEVDLALSRGVLETRRLYWNGPVSRGQASLRADTRGAEDFFELRLNSARLPLLWFIAGKGMPEQDAFHRLHRPRS